jgi:hypothetical protein
VGVSGRDELGAQLRAANVARDRDDPFFAELAELAIRSEPPLRRRGPTSVRVAGVVVGTGLLVSGGAVASALILINSGGHGGPEPRPAPTLHASVSASAGSADQTGQPSSDDSSAQQLPPTPSADAARGREPAGAAAGDGRRATGNESGRADQMPPAHAHGQGGVDPRDHVRGHNSRDAHRSDRGQSDERSRRPDEIQIPDVPPTGIGRPLPSAPSSAASSTPSRAD